MHGYSTENGKVKERHKWKANTNIKKIQGPTNTSHKFGGSKIIMTLNLGHGEKNWTWDEGQQWEVNVHPHEWGDQF